jgi:hypothetical protein
MNATANFIKHADEDADAIHEFDDEISDFMIAFAAKWYRDLGNSTSVEMNVFVIWWMLQRPDTFKPEIFVLFKKAGLGAQAEVVATTMTGLSRKDRLKAGQLLLDKG